MSSFISRTKNAFNAFMGRDPTTLKDSDYLGRVSSYNPNIRYGQYSKSIVNYVYNRIAVDVSMLNIVHARVNDDNRYLETIKDELNDVLTISANNDQTGREFIQDAVSVMFSEGFVALVPYETIGDPNKTDNYKICKVRACRILEWSPFSVQVEIYNEYTGEKELIWFDKSYTVIIQNPFYETMNEPNSVGKRLINTLNRLEDNNDKIGLIVQVPYPLRNEMRRKDVQRRIDDIEGQLTTSRHGIVYIDASEKVTQLNRPLDDVLWAQAKDLTDELYNQLGISKSLLDGTADESTMINYNNQTLNPIVTTLTDNMTRVWLNKSARSQGQVITSYRDPFKLMPASQIAETADKFTRNEIASSNEIRAVIGMKPSKDPKANELRNSNLNHPDEKYKLGQDS